MKKRQIKFIIATLISVLITTYINGQTPKPITSGGDSLELDWIIQEIIQHHPMVQSVKESLNKADAQIGLAKSGNYPNVGASANISTIGPVPTLSIPDMGTFSLYPRNNISGQVSVEQNIYDFGKTEQNITLAGKSKSITAQSLEEVKQNLTIQAIQIFYTLDYLQEAIKIKNEQLATLNEHLDFVGKKHETGSATEYEILSTKVKISGVETQQFDLEAARDVQITQLNLLLGLPAETFHTVKSVMNVDMPLVEGDSLIDYAVKNRNEMLIANEKEQLAAIQIDIVKLKNSPSLYLLANGGIKNGFVPEINKIRPNYVVGLGINIPIFDGTREKYNILKAQSELKSTIFETEITKRKISGEVVENETNIGAAEKKISQSKLQLQQALDALSLAQVSYKSGVITNLDLLDAATAVSESRLMLLKSQIDYVLNIYRLKASLGEKLY